MVGATVARFAAGITCGRHEASGNHRRPNQGTRGDASVGTSCPTSNGRGRALCRILPTRGASRGKREARSEAVGPTQRAWDCRGILGGAFTCTSSARQISIWSAPAPRFVRPKPVGPRIRCPRTLCRLPPAFVGAQAGPAGRSVLLAACGGAQYALRPVTGANEHRRPTASPSALRCPKRAAPFPTGARRTANPISQGACLGT